MASLIDRADEFAIATGNDTDSDRHGIVTPDAGLLDPNHYLAVAIDYLYRHRAEWPADAAVGKTMVSSSIIDRVAGAAGAHADRGAGGVQVVRAGAAGRLHRLRRRGERRGLVPAHRRPGLDHRQGRHHPGPARLGDHGGDRAVAGRAVPRPGRPSSATRPTPGSTRRPTRAQKALLAKLSPDQVSVGELAGEPVLDRLTRAPGNGEPLGGIKVITENGWFAARPSGTEDVYKLYAESFAGPGQLARIQEEAQQILDGVLKEADGT